MQMDLGNDIHTIHHVESLRRKASYYWPDENHKYLYGSVFQNHHNFRPALNLRALISLLSKKVGKQTSGDEDFSSSDECSAADYILGKRRRLDSTHGPSKRIRLARAARGYSNVEQDESSEVDEDEDDVNPEYKQIYPSYWESSSQAIGEVTETEDTSFLQVYQFGLHLRYDKMVIRSSDNYADNKTATTWGWLQQEESLCSLLQVRQRNASLSQDIDMGRFFMTRYLGHTLALSGPPPGNPPCSLDTAKEYSDMWLFLLPDIPWPDGIAEDDLEEQDILPSGMHRDFITACAVLQFHGRAKLEASLQLHILPEGTYDPTHDLPFELRAHFVLSLAIPETYNPFAGKFSQCEINELEGLQRRLVCFLSKTPLMRPVHGSAVEEATNVTIPFFLNIMRPAPPLAQDVMVYESLQPDGLLSILMPFQRRTVAWMLEREGKQITSAGTVAPLNASEACSSTASKRLPLFWEEIELGGRNLFFNRLTSALSPTLPKPHPALGGILAEEPGLLPSFKPSDCGLTDLYLLI